MNTQVALPIRSFPCQVVEAPDLAARAYTAWQATQIDPTPSDLCQVLAVLVHRLLDREVPIPAVPYLRVEEYVFSLCWAPGPTGAQHALSLVQRCETSGCQGMAFSPPIRSMADVGAVQQGGNVYCADCMGSAESRGGRAPARC